MDKKIKISDLLELGELKNYKLHFATHSGVDHPLDVFVRNENEWKEWNSYKGDKNIWTRTYVFSLIKYYYEKNKWLFGGIFEVISRREKYYEIKLTKKYNALTGRLMIDFHHYFKSRHAFLENHYDKMVISEILKEKYNGVYFPGYENINIDFSNLEQIFKNEKKDWKASLQNVKGVYVIFDKSNGKKYVGSAYGDSGIWSRWACYIGTGHGYNDELTKLIKEKTIDYARENFVFSLLEYRPMKTDDKTVISRESFWKKLFLSGNEKFGYNKN